MLQPEIQISRDILCVPVTLLKALLRKTATRQVLNPSVPHRQRFSREFHWENEPGVAQVHRFISCAKSKALEGGF